MSGSKDKGWLAANYDQLKSWTDQMLATDQQRRRPDRIHR